MNGIGGDHDHPETLGGDGDAGGDAAEADQSERRSVELERLGGHRARQPGGARACRTGMCLVTASISAIVCSAVDTVGAWGA